MLDTNLIRNDFPILSEKVNGRSLVYFDNGASSQKPKCVIDELSLIYQKEYANVHRGLHFLSNNLTDRYESSRTIFQKFVNAELEDEIIFTSGATEAFNLISYAWALPNLKEGDEIIISIMEHHANIVPWHFLRKNGIIIKWWYCDIDGNLDLEELDKLVTNRTRLISVTHMSNVLGSITNAKEICVYARSKNIKTALDGSQFAVHKKVDVQDIGCDFYVVTGHKLYGPSSSGFVYVRKETQEEMGTFLGGGDMIEYVTTEDVTYNKAPHKFEAGTPGIANQIGLGRAIQYISDIGIEKIEAHENSLRDYFSSKLNSLDYIETYGNNHDKGCIFAFNFKNRMIHPHDVSTILDKKGIAIRAGHHCAQPLMKFLNVSATSRASLSFYNTYQEIDYFVEAIEFCNDILS